VVDDAAGFLGSIPHHYDTGLGPVIFEHYAEVLARLVASTGARRILETAAGTGISSAALLRHNPQAELVVTDLNAPMLEIARTKLPAATQVQVADAQDLPFETGHFEAVVCQFGVMFYPDLGAGFREARRVLSPEGTFVFSVWDAHAQNPFAAVADALLADAFPDDKPSFYRVPFGRSDVDPLRRLAQECDFGAYSVDVVPHEALVSSWTDFATGLILGNPVADQIRSRGGDPAAVQAAAVRALEAEFGPAPTTMPIQALFHRATVRR
jgi:SAM-dependent methyltransferase